MIPSDVEVASPPPPPARQEAPVAPPPASPRTVRSTAEIMPIRMQRPSPPPPPVQQAGGVEIEEPEVAPPVVQWPAPESAMPSLFTTPGPAPVSQREPVRYAPPPPPPVYEAAPPMEAPAPPPERYVSVPFAASPGLPEAPAERKKISPVLIGAFVVALIALGGIFWMLRSSMSSGSAAPNVQITIYPTQAKVVEGKTADFAATVTGAPNDNNNVTWKVEEGDDGGQVQVQRGPQGANSLYSTYTAPKTPGTYHLVATSTADTTKSATADITVTAK